MSYEFPRILYENRFADASPAASTTATGYDVLNLRDWRPYTYWKPTAIPATVTVNCGSAKSADYALIWGHDLYTQGDTIQIRGSTDNFSASDVLVASHTPTSDNPFAVYFGTASYQYWRLSVITGTAPTIAIASIGQRLEIPGYLSSFDPTMRKAIMQHNISVGGYPIGSVLNHEEWEADLDFRFVNESSGWTWMRNTWVPAWRAHLRANPFVLAWSPVNYADELFLVTCDGEFQSPHEAPSFAGLAFNVRGRIES